MQMEYLLTSINGSPFTVGHSLQSCSAELTETHEKCDVEFDPVSMLECLQVIEELALWT